MASSNAKDFMAVWGCEYVIGARARGEVVLRRIVTSEEVLRIEVMMIYVI